MPRIQAPWAEENILSDGREAVDRRSLERLRGFDRIAVPKGQTVAVTLDVPEEDLMLWDMDKHAFMLNKGESKFMVGASSADIRLTETVKLK